MAEYAIYERGTGKVLEVVDTIIGINKRISACAFDDVRAEFKEVSDEEAVRLREQLRREREDLRTLLG